MSNVCLPPKIVTAFQQALKAGKIEPEKLAKMTSEERRKVFADIVGDGNAKATNSLFESKLLLKNQQQGMLTWAKQVAGMKPEIRRDLISRITKMDKVLDPAEEKAFLSDLAETRLGFAVSAKEAKEIADLSANLQEVAAKQKPDGTFPNEADRMAYGYAKVDMGDYIAQRKLAAEKLSPVQLLKDNPLNNASRIAGVSKSIKASLDNSVIFRQGWKTLWTNPKIWQKNARQTFVDIVRQVGDKPVMREIMADIVSRPNYRQYEKMKLALGNIEEDFPTSIQNKIPGVGRLFKASETAYEGFLYRTRADVADKYLKIAEAGGVNINDPKQLASIGKLINSLTGRGSLGAGEGSKAVSTWTNNLFFSIRFLKSNIDTLTAHQLQKDVTPFVRKQASINLLKIVSGTAAVLAVANALLPGSVETDPRSSDFGKIKVGSTKFDVTAGMGSLAVLVSRQITGQTKSTATGTISDYGSEFGETSRQDGIVDFITGKFSPVAALVRDLAKGKDFSGNPVTPQSSAESLFVPLPISNTLETAKDPNAAPWLIAMIADGLGIGSSTFSPERNVSQNLSPTMEAFKKSVGDDKFKKANDDYNKKYNEWLAANREKLLTLPAEEQPSTITTVKQRIQKDIYKDYGFTPPKASKSDTVKQTRKSLLDAVK